MYSRASKRLALLALAFGVVGLLVMPSVAFAHAHMKGGTPFRVPLVIAYTPVTAANPAGESHNFPPVILSASNSPADGAACGGPGGQESCALTVNSPDNPESPGPTQGQAGLRIDVCPTASTIGSMSLPAQPACTAPDDRIGVKITDVRCGPTGSPCGAPSGTGAGFDNAPGTALDYLGSISAQFTLVITDHDNTPDVSATSGVIPFPVPQYQGGQCLGAPSANCTDAGGNPTAMPCLDTPLQNGAVTATGSTCTIQTTVNTYFPGLIKAAKLANWEMGQVQVLDSAGVVFAVQGIFNP